MKKSEKSEKGEKENYPVSEKITRFPKNYPKNGFAIFLGAVVVDSKGGLMAPGAVGEPRRRTKTGNKDGEHAQGIKTRNQDGEPRREIKTGNQDGKPRRETKTGNKDGEPRKVQK